MLTPELLPCPLCGNAVRVNGDPNWIFIRCESCGCEGPDAERYSTPEAIIAWNARFPVPQDPAGEALDLFAVIRELVKDDVEAVGKGLWTADSGAYRLARLIAGSLKPGNYLARMLSAERSEPGRPNQKAPS